MTPKEFQDMLIETLEWMTLRELADQFRDNLWTMRRWVSGNTAPMMGKRLRMRDEILELRGRRVQQHSGTYGGTRGEGEDPVSPRQFGDDGCLR
jgi:hypothetical protein